MLVVIAGGTGRLGTAVAGRLVEAGHRVRVFSRGLTPRPALDPRVEVAVADVRDPASLPPVLAGASVVVSAVQGFVGRGGATPANTDRDGNVALVDAARAAGADVVLVSLVNASPESPLELGRAKAAAEEHLRRSGVRWTIVRSDAFTQAWVALLEQTSKNGRPVVFGRADNPVAWVDVEDVADVVTAAVLDGSLRGRTLDVCGPERLTLGQLALAVMRRGGVAGRPRRVPRPVLHVAARTVGVARPVLGRQMRAALAMDVMQPADDAATRAALPGLAGRGVSEVLGLRRR
ncbi:SDR family oxidoreductase [Georgenia muralis]|uniref:Uncharacterized protein YbjT (DUF2867 family) n=1 Tax=Georgenia muralis TaxID=154117 RepID=A0A3N4ZPY2_9MICO|nr:NAD(P)H-binding protein [Georgenia muralis]RPF27708.1 uncharacterized protein YbjT (DUF2867 family) [Georgenia muralis]